MFEETAQLRSLITLVQKSPMDASRSRLLIDHLAQQLQADIIFFDQGANAVAVSTGWHDQVQKLSDVQLASLSAQIPGLRLSGPEQYQVLQYSLDGWGIEPLEMLHIPVLVHGQRLGNAFIVRGQGGVYQPQEILFAEMNVLLCAMEWVNHTQATNNMQQRMGEVARQAIGTLSYSELQAVDVILGELDGNEGVLVASRIADREQITRSVIVNALRKVESAGLIETRSLGMKGTYIRVLNDKLIEELKYL